MLSGTYAQQSHAIGLITAFELTDEAGFAKDADARAILEGLREFYRPTYNLRFGFDYLLPIQPNWSIRTGLRLAHLGTKTEEIHLRFGSQADPDNPGMIDPDLPSGEPFEKVQFTRRSQFFEIPILFRYAKPSDRKWTTSWEGGIATNVHLRSTTTTILDEQTSNQQNTDSLVEHPVQLSAVVGFGINFAPTRNWTFYTQPTGRFHFLPTGNTAIRWHWYSVGLEFGVRRTLGS